MVRSQKKCVIARRAKPDEGPKGMPVVQSPAQYSELYANQLTIVHLGFLMLIAIFPYQTALLEIATSATLVASSQ